MQALGCVRGEMLWSFAVPSVTVALDCVAVSSSDSLTADESQHIDKCEVSCIRMNNFKLLPHVAGCEINCSGKKKNLGIIMDTSLETSALYRALVERGKKFNLEHK